MLGENCSVATDFERRMERRMNAMECRQKDRDAQLRQKQAIECELHRRDLQRHHGAACSTSRFKAAARVRAKADVVPAIEQFGEGIFIHFDECAIRHWLGFDATKARAEKLVGGYLHWTKRFPDKPPKYPGTAYCAPTQPVARSDGRDRARLRLSGELAEGTRLCGGGHGARRH
jgi:hypothetical protein